jgi:membrane protein YqaA with SNARE-associated domain
MSVYPFILINSFQSAVMISLHAEYGWWAARDFGRPDIIMITVMAVIGSTLGMALNYWLGYWVARNGVQHMHISESAYKWISNYFRYLTVLLLFPQLPFLPVFAALCGFFRVPPAATIAVVVLGRIGYYSYYLLQQ